MTVSAIDWVVDGVPPMSPSTTMSQTVRMASSNFGDGYQQRTTIGINPISDQISVAYEYLSPTQHATLRDFVLPLVKSGATVRIPHLLLDPSGNTKIYGYVQSAVPSVDADGALFNWAITVQQVFQ